VIKILSLGSKIELALELFYFWVDCISNEKEWQNNLDLLRSIGARISFVDIIIWG